jgi:hypothetical protein
VIVTLSPSERKRTSERNRLSCETDIFRFCRRYFVSVGDISFLLEIFRFYITCRPPEANGTASITSPFRSSEFNSGRRRIWASALGALREVRLRCGAASAGPTCRCVLLDDDAAAAVPTPVLKRSIDMQINC